MFSEYHPADPKGGAILNKESTVWLNQRQERQYILHMAHFHASMTHFRDVGTFPLRFGKQKFWNFAISGGHGSWTENLIAHICMLFLTLRMSTYEPWRIRNRYMSVTGGRPMTSVGSEMVRNGCRYMLISGKMLTGKKSRVWVLWNLRICRFMRHL